MAKDDKTSALAALRRRIDEVDDGLQDLLIRRTELVEEIGRLKRASGADTFRPGREAQVLRRLLGRHRGRFPAAALVRIWREIMSSAVAVQGTVSVAVCAGCWDLARDHFGSLAPLLALPTADETMLAVAEGRAGLGVLPLAEDDGADPWWLKLATPDEAGPRVIARLPFGALGNAAGYQDAFVIALMGPEPSGDDFTLLAIEAGAALSGAGLTDAFLATRIHINPMACAERDGCVAHLVEVEALLASGDQRLAPVRKAIGADGRVAWLGIYARPLPDAAMDGVAPE
jgi:chorismate mutase / prephenate dehydratase